MEAVMKVTARIISLGVAALIAPAALAGVGATAASAAPVSHAARTVPAGTWYEGAFWGYGSTLSQAESNAAAAARAAKCDVQGLLYSGSDGPGEYEAEAEALCPAP
jgi:hypothetical protein